MPKIEYVPKDFKAETLATIEQADAIVREYAAAGYALTLRQLYYQFVARGLIENSQRSYKRLGSIVNDARLAGLLDWEAIEDRTRSLQRRPHWESPGGVVHSAAASYGIDLWEGQPERVEVWVEKEALAGVVAKPAERWDVPYFCCRGYASQSEVWRASERMLAYGVPVTVLHLGDHDPSGIDMTRDIEDRLNDVFGVEVMIRRIALNMDQVQQYSPPPNPAKLTDSRCGGYMQRFGDESWELDALPPQALDKLIGREIEKRCDLTEWHHRHDEQERDRALLENAADRWDEVVEFLEQEQE